MSTFPAGGQSALPGIGPLEQQTSRVFLSNDEHVVVQAVKIDDTTQDVGNSVVTKLRPGLALVRVEAAGANLGKYVHVTHADAPAAPDIIRAVLLLEPINMKAKDGSTLEDKTASGLIHGFVTESQVIFGTADAPTIDAIKDALSQVMFQ